MASQIDENEQQKLIDGELDLPATRRLLGSLDANSDQWRQIATAFVEDRIWQRSFEQLEQESNPSNIDPPKPETAAKVNLDRTSTGAGFPSWLALAAGLLLAAGVGYFAGSGVSMDKVADPMEGLVATGNPSETVADPVTSGPDVTLAELTPEYELELTDAMGIGKSSVPIYSARRLSQLPQSQRKTLIATGPSEQEIQRLQQSGYRLQQNVDYLSGQLKDGRTFVVPVRTVNLSSGQ